MSSTIDRIFPSNYARSAYATAAARPSLAQSMGEDPNEALQLLRPLRI